jgi:hypothetical protein
MQAVQFVHPLALLQGLKKIKRVDCLGTDPLKLSDARQLRPDVIFERFKLRVRLHDLTPEPFSAGLTPQPLPAALTAEPLSAGCGHAKQTNASKAFCSHRELRYADAPSLLLIYSSPIKLTPRRFSA